MIAVCRLMNINQNVGIIEIKFRLLLYGGIDIKLISFKKTGSDLMRNVSLVKILGLMLNICLIHKQLKL